MNDQVSALIAEQYKYYNEIIKPMLANVESKYENHPLSLFNEIRAFNDHIARCYRSDVDDNYCLSQINKAKIHLERLLLDLYKFLNVYYYEKVQKFERQTKRIDLTTISNGEFYIKYRRLRGEAVNIIREAKSLETLDKPEALIRYQDANNIMEELDAFIDSNMTGVNWARAKFVLYGTGTILLWLVAAIISGIISNLTGWIPYEEIIKRLTEIF